MIAFTATALGVLVLLAGFVLLLVGIWVRVSGDRIEDMWPEAFADPAFRADIEAGLADAKAGRTRPWSEVRREHWPGDLDSDPLLDVQNHVGDSRPIR